MAKTIEITEEQLAALLEQNSKLMLATAREMLAGQPAAQNAPASPLTLDENFAALKRARAEAVTLKPIPVEVIARVTSPETNAIFDVEEQTIVHVDSHGNESPPRKVVTNLLNYTFPVGFDVSVDEGGSAPRGMMVRDPQTGQYSKQFRHHMWTEFHQADLNRFIGKPLPKAIRSEAEAASVAAAQ